ncbi:YebC/PmpR family DNA-binding transcriptional regulator [Ilumatobacter sp.]|uniref:YebC/PmpR family DNA-binding transcriptional regulator n=1 Tax=Ilumatobacter sp. TaxID=1967498 RepID=UPI003B5158D8
MSGHSKWATIKHKKGAADKARGKLFAKLARQIEVSARGGGGDVDANPTLRTAVQKAKGAQMTNDAIERAIKRGTGESGDDIVYETIMYEGYAPGGVALLIDVLTDNRNRISADVRQVFSKLGGSMAEPGAVGWQFSRKGVIITADGIAEDDVMLAALDAGADDIIAEGDAWRITTEPSDVFDVQDQLGGAGIETLSADSPMVAENLVAVTDLKDAKAILRILEALEDNDDVQDVYSNFDISDELMEEAAAG